MTMRDTRTGTSCPCRGWHCAEAAPSLTPHPGAVLLQESQSFPGTQPALEPSPSRETPPPQEPPPPPGADPGAPGVVSPILTRSVPTPILLLGALQPVPGQREQPVLLSPTPAGHEPRSKASPAPSKRSRPAARKEPQPPDPPQPPAPLQGAAERPEQPQVVGFYLSPPQSHPEVVLTLILVLLSCRMCQRGVGMSWSPLGALWRARLPILALRSRR